MKYQCNNCHEVFIHTAKQTKNIRPSFSEIPDDVATRYVNLLPDEIIETAVCPFCHNVKFDEFVEPQPNIISVKSVDLNEVDTYLKDGYIVEAMFAKTATIKKLEVKP